MVSAMSKDRPWFQPLAAAPHKVEEEARTDVLAADTAHYPACRKRSFPVLKRGSFHRRAGVVLPGLACLLLLAGCHAGKGNEASREAAEAPPANPAVVASPAAQSLHVDDPQSFPLVRATTASTFATLDVTGSVQPDPSREVPVLSLANGRVVALHVGLGNTVRKGQLIMDVQSPDVATAFGAYLKAVADEHLTATQLTRTQLLFSKGAVAQSQLEVAQNGEQDARADLTAAGQQLRILGVDPAHPSDTVHVYAPIAGVVVSQNTTAAGLAGATLAGTTGSITIADLSHVWVVCDVYENDLASVHQGESAQLRFQAFPDQPRTGTISDIGAILDPTIRTAKVRIQVPNPDRSLRIGMFATATLRNGRPLQAVSVPAAAVLHLHDVAFVFIPINGAGNFRRAEVRTGPTLAGNAVQILSGLPDGQQVVANALELQNAATQ